MHIYIESTIPSYVVARPARDLLQAARQQLTRDWWEFRRAGHELFTSQLVLDEIAFGETEMAGRRLELMSGLTLLESTEQAGELTGHIMRSGLLPAKAPGRRSAHCAGDRASNGYSADMELPAHCQCVHPRTTAPIDRVVRPFRPNHLHAGGISSATL